MFVAWPLAICRGLKGSSGGGEYGPGADFEKGNARDSAGKILYTKKAGSILVPRRMGEQVEVYVCMCIFLKLQQIAMYLPTYIYAVVR